MLDEFKDLRDGMEEYLEIYHKQFPEKFDYIFVCGDIAFSGEENQYKKARVFIKKLCNIVGCTDEEVLMVPGNHDKFRNEPPKLLRESLNELMGKDTHRSDLILDDALQNNILSCKFLFEPFRFYDKFSSDFGSREPLMAKMLSDKPITSFEESEDKMYWSRELSDNLKGFKVIAYGVNTAFTCDGNDFDFSNTGKIGHKVFLSKFAYNEPRHKCDTINIFMAHHPIAFLANGDDIEKVLDKCYQIQFFGHVHRTNSDNDGAIHIFSGALQPPGDEVKSDDYRPVFNIVSIDIEKSCNNDDKLVVDMDVIAWNGKKFEKDPKKSKPLSLQLKKSQIETVQTRNISSLPQNVTKNQIRMRFLKYPLGEEVINDIAPDFYKDEIIDYINRLNFLEYVDENMMWNELWNKMNDYEG